MARARRSGVLPNDLPARTPRSCGARPRRRCSPPAAPGSATIRAISSTSRLSPRSSPASTIGIRSRARSAGRPSSASSTSATGIMSRATPASSPSRMPRPTEQTVLHVRFDEAGNVESVEPHRARAGRRTSSRAARRRRRSAATAACFEELFGNIGAVGQRGQSAPDRRQSGLKASGRSARRRARPASPGPRRSRSSPRSAPAASCRPASARSPRRRPARAAAWPRCWRSAGRA